MITVGQEIPEYFLLPSMVWVSREPHRVQTILGSCVTVCLYDERMKWGGINHYMLSNWDGKGLPSPKYGDVAIDLIVEKMLAIGSYKQNLVAKIFGGASQFSRSEGGVEVGYRNIKTAEFMLKKIGIKIIAQSVGGTQGRKIVFNTSTGQVLMKFLESTYEKD